VATLELLFLILLLAGVVVAALAGLAGVLAVDLVGAVALLLIGMLAGWRLLAAAFYF